MTPNEYQKLALRTASENDDIKLLMNCTLGLNGEAGEFADHIKKWLYQGHEKDDEALIKELGDILWYVAVAAFSLGYELEDVMKLNVEKLNKRYPDGFSKERSVNRKE